MLPLYRVHKGGTMSDPNLPEYTNAEGLALALHYLNDPSDVPCPTCGPGTMEVVAYLDVEGMQRGVVRAAAPDGDYTVVLYCHACRRAAALDLSPDSHEDDGQEDRRAA
jgi:hypothetical protein